MRVSQALSDCSGVVLPYVAIMLIAIIGLAGLAIDSSRLMSVQTQLQNAADALALAGAAELDRRPDSIIRARAAIDNLIANPIVGAGNDRVAQVANVEFLRSLPVSQDLPISEANLTDDPTLAAYVQVTVKPVSMLPLFPMSMSAERRTIGVGAQAVAGYDQVVCNVTPLYVCNPFEAPGMTYYQATQALVEASQDPASQRRLIRLAGSANGAYTRGTTGYIAPDTGLLPAASCGPGAGYGIPQALAASQVRACFRLSAVNLLPSEDRPAMDGLNTRFDIYANGFSSCRIYAPDQNVRKGFTTVGNIHWCSAAPWGPGWPQASAPAGAAPLPVDQNMVRGDGTFDTTIEVGNGVWNCAQYWSIAHAVGPGKNSPPPGCTATATISRYSVYTYEMNFLSDRSLSAETGAPQCAPPGENNRRVVVAAIVNCGSSPVPMHADAQAAPVAAFGRFFLVLPAESGTNGSPYAEFLGLVPRSDPLSSDLVELYR